MNITLFSVSLRKNSFNGKLLNIVDQLVREQSNSSNVLDLNDFQMPYYNQDILDQDGFPATAEALKKHILDAHALIIASPEYNFSMPGHFKNTIDWLSRYRPTPFRYKPILLLSASPSLVGANRGLWALRLPLEALSAHVFPDMFSLAQAYDSFTVDNKLKNADLEKRLAENVTAFLKFATALT